MYFFLADYNDEQVKVLYEARGHEIRRLQEQVRGLQENEMKENRRLQHEKALLLADKNKLEAEVRTVFYQLG